MALRPLFTFLVASPPLVSTYSYAKIARRHRQKQVLANLAETHTDKPAAKNKNPVS